MPNQPRRGVSRFISFHPTAEHFARTGDSVQVNVLRFKNLAPALNTVIVALQSDTSTVVDTQNVIAPKFVDTLSVLDIFAGSGQGSAVDTYNFFFPVALGDPVTAPDGVVAQALIQLSSDGDFFKLNNVSTTPQSDVTGFTDPVGDGKRIGIDGSEGGGAAQQASADIQTTPDGKASTATEVSGKSGGEVVIEVLASGFDGALGVNTSFTLSDAAAITNVAGTHQTGFNFPPNAIQGWSAGSTTFSFQSGGLSAASETGDGLKVSVSQSFCFASS